MAIQLLAHEVSDLCLGKPPLTSLPITTTIRHALAILKSSDESHVSIWTCDHHSTTTTNHLVNDCRCVGKICMVDIICYLCKDDNMLFPFDALNTPVSVLVSRASGVVKHVEPSFSLLEAIDLIINGTQNLVIPITNKTSKTKQLRQHPSHTPTTHAGGQEYCWLTQEDIIRFLINSIGLFSQTATYSINSLGIISPEILTVNYHLPASKAVDFISTSLTNQTSVAVVDDDGVLIGEISPVTLTYCDEMVAAAVTTLTAGDLMAYIDCGGPPEDIIRLVETRLKEQNLNGMFDQFLYNATSSSDDESLPSPKSTIKSGRYHRSTRRRSEAIVCSPGSSLVAVMIQAIAHRVSYVWVIEDDCSLVGIVKFSGMLEVFREHLENTSMVPEESSC